MKYGYYGATPTQSFNNNKGIFSTQSATNLRKENNYSVGSDWVLIQRSTSTGTTAFEFTNCFESVFRTHVVVVKDIIPTGTDNNPIKLMVGNSSGTYLTDYKIAVGEMYNNTYGAYRGTKAFMRIIENTGNDTYESAHCVCYVYDMGISEYTRFSAQSVGTYNTYYKIGLLGTGFEKSAGVRTRLKVQGENAQTNLSGTVELYGIF